MGLGTLTVAWIRMIRPPILFLCSFGAVVSALNCAIYMDEPLSLFQILFLILAPAFLSTGTMFHNDITDLESDKINRPHKPVPSGLLKKKTVYYTGLVLMIGSIFLASLVNYIDTSTINWECGILTVFLVIIGLYYNYYGKHHGLIGHMAVAFGVGAIPYWGGLAVFPNQPLLMLPLAVALFLQETGREIMVCAGDYIGDIKAGFKTTPVRHGRKRSMQIALLFYLLFIPIFPLSAFDWAGLKMPQVFGALYLIGGSILAASLIITWFRTYMVVIKTDDEKMIWKSFERNERIGTRVMIIVFQIFILLELFY
ncbi:MAG: 4-hydroxybenzoate polyprenyltransferase [Thermoplasmata archaeon M9B2D]|nr:MAG: 4-hydroxybenzoate polyprenyltransferase [Thermoplasmata archaeon M9B2D]